jgi:hypothetical protein
MLAGKTKEIANLVLENVELKGVETGRELSTLTHIRVRQEDGPNITEYAVSESATSQTEMTTTNGIEWASSHKTKTTFIYKFARRKQKKGLTRKALVTDIKTSLRGSVLARCIITNHA